MLGLNAVLPRLHVPTSGGILLVLVVAALPYTTYVMRVAYDVAYVDEARTLGTSPRSVSWRVRLPLPAPGVASAAFPAFLVGWSDYVVTRVIGGARFVTVLRLVASAAAGTGNEPTVAALSMVTAVRVIGARRLLSIRPDPAEGVTGASQDVHIHAETAPGQRSDLRTRVGVRLSP